MLHIVGRRPDGYHELQTVFQLIDLCDRIEITVRERRGRLPGPRVRPGVPEDEDLVVRAARALQAASGTDLGAEIAVRKRIPMGGGLGGGSSDAATTLVALNQMWQLGLTSAQIGDNWRQIWALMCPFSSPGRSAWAEGIGEKLTPVTLGADSWYLVIFPGVARANRRRIPGS